MKDLLDNEKLLADDMLDEWLASLRIYLGSGRYGYFGGHKFIFFTRTDLPNDDEMETEWRDFSFAVDSLDISDENLAFDSANRLSSYLDLVYAGDDNLTKAAQKFEERMKQIRRAEIRNIDK